MNAGGPTCGSCGGVNVNPQSYQCRFCGQALMQPQQQQQQQPYGGGGGYGGPPQNYGGPPQQNYGYGGPPPPNQNPYGGPSPNPYGGPNPNANPYANPYGGVQPFGGVQSFNGPRYVQRSGWSSGWSTFVWVRLVIAAIAIGISLIGACISAMSH